MHTAASLRMLLHPAAGGIMCGVAQPGKPAAAMPLPCRCSNSKLLRPTTFCPADANVTNPKEYWDYENLQIEWG